MLKAVITSLILHSSILGVVAVMSMTFHGPKKPSPPKNVQVSILSLDQFTQLTAPKPESRKKEQPRKKKQQKKAKKSAIREATTKKEQKLSQDYPKKTKKKNKKEKLSEKAKKQVIAKENSVSARKAKKDFVPEIMAALLDKQPFDDIGSVKKTKQVSKPKSKPSQSEKKIGKSEKLTADDHSYIISKVGSCWNMPVGHLGAESMVVKIDLNFKIDGTLSGRPTVRVSSRSIAAKVVEETAVRAIISCQPYRLPRRKYQNWKALTFVFDPRDLYEN